MELLYYEREPSSLRDRYAVAVKNMLSLHVPRKVPKLMSYIWKRDCSLVCASNVLHM